jgi:hypothetical protein
MAGIYAVLKAGILYLITCPNDESNPESTGAEVIFAGGTLKCA